MARAQRRQPRLANMVAAELRDRILSGELRDGSLLPKQEDLFAEFRVSLPSIREALRILETEGLVTVLRGNTGGAAIHRPQANKLAYMLALLLQYGGVGVDDAASALRDLEALCASLAAGREDRGKTIVPVLDARNKSSRAALEDADEFVHQARTFHEELVAGCGNETLILIVGSLESLWSAHVDQLVRRPSRLGAFGDLATRRKMLDDHVKLVRAIDRGDARRAEQQVRAHFSAPERYDFIATATKVRAALLLDD